MCTIFSTNKSYLYQLPYGEVCNSNLKGHFSVLAELCMGTIWAFLFLGITIPIHSWPKILGVPVMTHFEDLTWKRGGGGWLSWCACSPAQRYLNDSSWLWHHVVYYMLLTWMEYFDTCYKLCTVRCSIKVRPAEFQNSVPR